MDTAGVIRRVQNLFGDNNEIIITLPMMVDWINEGQLEITRTSKHKVMAYSVAANVLIDVGSTVTGHVGLMTLHYGEVPLALTYPETIDRMGLYQVADGTPTAYYSIGDTVYLFPQPAAGDTTPVTIRYAALPTDLGDETDPLDIPLRYHTDLVTYVISKAHEQNENFSAARHYLEKFEKDVLIRDSQTENQDDSFHIKQPDIMTYGTDEWFYRDRF